VDVRLAAGPGEHLHLEGQSVEEVVEPAQLPRRRRRRFAELRVLGRDADRTAAGVGSGSSGLPDADRPLVVGDAGDLLVAVERHQRRVADGDGVRPRARAFATSPPVADAAGDDEVDLVGQADVLERPAGLRNGRHEGDAGLLSRDVRAGSRASFGTSR